jgi:hypothetical protein
MLHINFEKNSLHNFDVNLGNFDWNYLNHVSLMKCCHLFVFWGMLKKVYQIIFLYYKEYKQWLSLLDQYVSVRWLVVIYVCTCLYYNH